MTVYGLPSGQGLDRRNDMTLAFDMGHIIPAVQALAIGQSINLQSGLRLGFHCLISGWSRINLKHVSGNVLILLLNSHSKA